MYKFIKNYVQSCDTCQRTKSRTTKENGLLHPLPVPRQPWDEISLDLVTHLPRTPRGHDAIVVFVDRLSKQAHFIPTTSKVTAKKLAEIFFKEIFRLHGMPRHIVSDHDTRFTSKF